MSAMMLTAGVGCATVEPPASPTSSTISEPTVPSARPSTTAAGAIHTLHGGTSLGGAGAGSRAGGGSGAGGGAGGWAGDGGTLLMVVSGG